MTDRRHSFIECRDAIAGVIGEKTDYLRKVNTGQKKFPVSREVRRIRENQLSTLNQCLRDYEEMIAREERTSTADERDNRNGRQLQQI